VKTYQRYTNSATPWPRHAVFRLASGIFLQQLLVSCKRTSWKTFFFSNCETSLNARHRVRQLARKMFLLSRFMVCGRKILFQKPCFCIVENSHQNVILCFAQIAPWRMTMPTVCYIHELVDLLHATMAQLRFLSKFLFETLRETRYLKPNIAKAKISEAHLKS